MLRDLRWVTVAETVTRLSSFVTVPILTNALLPARYGLYKSVFVAAGVVLIGQRLFGIGYLVQKRLPEIDADSARQSLVSAVLVAQLSLVVFALACLYGASELSLLSLASAKLQTVVSTNFALVVVLVLAKGFYQGLLPVLQGLEAFTAYSVFKLTRELVILAAVVALSATGGLTVVTAIAAFALTETGVVLLCAVRLRSALSSRPDFRALWEQFTNISLSLVPRAVTKVVGGRLPEVLVLAYLGEAVFASWTVVLALANVFQLFSKPFSQMLIPEISDRVNDGRPLDTLVEKFYKTMLLVCVPLVVGGTLVGTDLIRYFFGKEYGLPTATVAVFFIAFGIQTVDSLGGNLFIGTGETGRETVRFVTSMTVRLAFVVVGTVVFESLLVIGVGYVLENLVRFVVSVRYQRTLVSLPTLSPRDVTAYVAVLGVMGVVVASADPYVTDLLTTVAVVLVGAVTYFLGILLSGLLSDDDLRLLRRLVGV